MVLAGFSSNFVDSYDGDDARCFCHEWDVAVDRYFEVTRLNGQLEFALTTSQDALSAMEGEVNVVGAHLAKSDLGLLGKSSKFSLISSPLPLRRSSNDSSRSSDFNLDGTIGGTLVGAG